MGKKKDPKTEPAPDLQTVINEVAPPAIAAALTVNQPDAAADAALESVAAAATAVAEPVPPEPVNPDLPEPVIRSREEADKIREANAFEVLEGEPDRRRYIGGSNVAALMGVAPEFDGQRDTPLTVFLAKVGQGESAMPPEKRLFLNRRKRWEGPITEMLREEFDAEIVSVNRRLVDPEYSFMASELDFEWLDPETGLIENGEIKTVSPFAFKEKFGWGEPGTSDVPIHYYMQCMHGLGVTGRRKTMLAAMVGLDGMFFYPIARSEDLIADMRRVCYRFWMDFVLKGITPDPMSMGDLKTLFKSSTPGLSVAANSDIGSKALHLRGMRAQIDAIELEAIALEFDIKNAMKSAEKLTVDGRDVFSWKEQKWSMLDQTNLKIAEKEIWRKYLLSGTRRVFKPMYGGT